MTASFASFGDTMLSSAPSSQRPLQDFEELSSEAVMDLDGEREVMALILTSLLRRPAVPFAFLL